MAIVRPLLKKRTQDPNDPASYRPISNLSFVSKVIEKVVDARLTDHVNKHHLLPVFKSFHSTETAIACILNHMIGAVDQGHVGTLMLLDLSATFDTVDHQSSSKFYKGDSVCWGRPSIGWLTTLVVEVRLSQQVAVTENSALHFGDPQG